MRIRNKQKWILLAPSRHTDDSFVTIKNKLGFSEFSIKSFTHMDNNKKYSFVKGLFDWYFLEMIHLENPLFSLMAKSTSAFTFVSYYACLFVI